MIGAAASKHSMRSNSSDKVYIQNRSCLYSGSNHRQYISLFCLASSRLMCVVSFQGTKRWLDEMIKKYGAKDKRKRKKEDEVKLENIIN